MTELRFRGSIERAMIRAAEKVMNEHWIMIFVRDLYG